MYLCHKCAGLLVHEADENVAGLHGCRCISGYYRGWEKSLTRREAIQTQIRQAEAWIRLYENQGRSESEIRPERERIVELTKLLEVPDEAK